VYFLFLQPVSEKVKSSSRKSGPALACPLQMQAKIVKADKSVKE
jgi:hypothetical protein